MNGFTMQQIAQLALVAQDASNLSGIVHAFSNLLPDLRTHIGTSPNKHAVSILFVTQFAYLTGVSSTGCESMILYSRAYEWAKNQAQSTALIPWSDDV